MGLSLSLSLSLYIYIYIHIYIYIYIYISGARGLRGAVSRPASSGVGVQGSGFRVQGSGLGVGVEELGFRDCSIARTQKALSSREAHSQSRVSAVERIWHI